MNNMNKMNNMNNMKANSRKSSTGILNIMAIIVIVSVVMLLAYYQKGIYPFGDGTVSYGDMAQGTIPLNLYYMWDVLHGKADAFFSWNLGFGLNFSGAASQSAVFSPLNLFILLSSRENLLNFVNILMIIKTICIAISMYVYSNKYKVDTIVRVGASILYSFGAASLIHYNIMFIMDMAFLLPILMIGYDRIFTKKRCDLFIIICSFCLIENAYMSAMVLLFVLLVSGIHVIHTSDEGEKGECAFLLGMSVVISIMISAVVVMPALYAISNSSRTQQPVLDTYMKALASSWSNADWTRVRFMLVNMTFPIAVIIYNLIHRKDFKEKYNTQILLSVLMLIPMVVSGTELLWHGGSRVNWPMRFVFILSFVVIDLSMKLLQDMDFNDIKSKNIYGIIAVIIGIICGWKIYKYCLKLSDLDAYKETIFLLIVCFCGFGYYCILQNIKKRVVLGILLIMMEISFMMNLFIAPNMYNTNEYSINNIRDAQIIKDHLPYDIKPFERVKNSDGKMINVNYSLIMGTESLANYVHVIDSSFQQKLKKWGYSKDFYTRLLDTGGTIFTDTLFGIKYVISGSELSEDLYEKISECDGYTGIHYYIYKNKYSIPFVSGFDYNLDVLSDDMFQNQNIIFSKTTGIDENLIDEYLDINTTESTNIEVGSKKVIYFYGVNATTDFIKVNGNNIVIPKMEDINNLRYPVSYNNNIIYLGCFENQTVSIEFGNIDNAGGIHIGLLDVETFERGIENINKSFLEVPEVDRTNTSVRIKLKCDNSGYIFIPILKDKGWRCKVNGINTDVEDAFGFVKVYVQKGENVIKLSYVLPNQNIGIIITIAGIAVCMFFSIIRKTYFNKKEQIFKAVYSLSYVLLVAVFGGVVILFYVIPIIKYLQRVFVLIS